MAASNIKEVVRQLPNQPGVYKFFNKESTLIYVGKAKNLKKRVSSYFNRSNQANFKTKKMASEVEAIEFTIVNSEFDALLLENNLIKQNQPKYNIQLRDDKSYPHILVKNERFPRIFSTRRITPNDGDYYGPYTSVKAMNNVLELIRDLYTIRTCNLNLSKENIEKKKLKVCLEYHLGNCKGPCEGFQSEEDYIEEIEHAEHILKGNIGMVRQHFKEQMQKNAEALRYEQAQRYKDKLELLEKFQSKSLVVNQKITSLDVFTIVSDEKRAYVNFLSIKDGAIVVAETTEVKKKLNEDNEKILGLLIVSLREEFGSNGKTILTNIPVGLPLENVEFIVPKIGDKKKLVELSLKNALFLKKDRLSQSATNKTKQNRVLLELQESLQLKNIPKHIECFDNSNLQGSNPVASMVCFRNGKPAKKDYRHFNIKTVTGPDDFASMKEIVFRRYGRLLNEEKPLPDLIIIDGGKGQLSAACEALKSLKVYGQIPIIGIAKRLEEIYFPEDSYPLHLQKKSESLKLIQKLRDEAHRFAITFHRSKRSKQQVENKLEKIEGIGPKTADKLLSTFKSVRKISLAPDEEIEKIVGKKKAQIVIQALK